VLKKGKIANPSKREAKKSRKYKERMGDMGRSSVAHLSIFKEELLTCQIKNVFT